MQATVKSPNWVQGSYAPLAVSLDAGLLRNCRRSSSARLNQTTDILGEFMKRVGCIVTVLICLLATLPAVYGQSVTGQISGTVVDPAGAIVPGATVQLTHDLSQQTRKFVTESNGGFIFTSLVPGAYSLHVVLAGFKGYDQKGITVAAQERVDLHEIHLAVGEVTSTVEVQGSDRTRGDG